MNRLKKTVLFLFDLDGTLVKDHGGHKKVFTDAIDTVFSIKGASIEKVAYHGMTDKGILLKLLEDFHGIERNEVLTKSGECFEVMGMRYGERIKEFGVSRLDFSEACLKSLKEASDDTQRIIGVVTGNVESIGVGKLENVGLLKWFDTDSKGRVIGGFGDQEIDRSELVRCAIKRAENCFGLSLSKTVVIGDTPRDAIAGNGAGATTFLVSTGPFARDVLDGAEADRVFNNLHEALPSLLNVLVE